MSVNIDTEIKKMERKSFYDSDFLNALRKAKEYAGKEGFVASMPQLLHGRVTASADDEIWESHYQHSALSEENVGRTRLGNEVFVAVHGGGILTPERIEGRHSRGLCEGRLTKEEVQNISEGKLPDGTIIPVFSFESFKRLLKLPMQYAVAMDLDIIRRTESGYQKISKLYDNPLFIVRAGGVEQAAAYLDKVRQFSNANTVKLGNWHHFSNINPANPQGRMLFLDGDYRCEKGLSGYDHFFCMSGRFIGVAPKAPETTEKTRTKQVTAPTLEQVLAVANKFTAGCNREDLQKELEALYK